MIKVVLIRHFETPGNRLKRYIGTTDEPLCDDITVNSSKYPDVELLFSSPMLRCLMTARLIYGEKHPIVCEKLKECDFGLFENKNYMELSDEPAYQRWIDSGGTLPFPEGESGEQFKSRCIEGFVSCIEEAFKRQAKSVGFIVHGGSIMAVMEWLSQKEGSYYNFQVKNGDGYVLEIESEFEQN